MPNASDDVEALTVFFMAARDLGVSHLSLVGPGYSDSGPLDSRREDVQTVTLSYPREGVANMKIRHFSDVAEPIRSAFARIDAEGAHTLILDLRGNRGGDLSSIAVAEHLFDETLRGGLFTGALWWRSNEQAPNLHGDEALPVLSEHDQSTFFSMLAEHGAFVVRASPVAPHFAGPVYVLIDGRTASASEPLVEMLKSTGRATLIGEPTAGAMLSSQTFELNSGLMLIVPTADYHTADGRRLEGAGVEPDIAVDSADALDETLRLIDQPR
jgi:C-terminal processing protease CtpA/Prc